MYSRNLLSLQRIFILINLFFILFLQVLSIKWYFFQGVLGFQYSSVEGMDERVPYWSDQI